HRRDRCALPAPTRPPPPRPTGLSTCPVRPSPRSALLAPIRPRSSALLAHHPLHPRPPVRSPPTRPATPPPLPTSNRITPPPAPTEAPARTRRRALGALAGLVGLTTACTSGGEGTGGAAGAGAAPGGFPLEIANCEATLRFDAPPERIVLLESAPVTTLDGIGGLDRVVGGGGVFPPRYYEDELADRIEAIPALSEDIDASGHLQISQEMVIALTPDIVFGLPDGVTREALADAGAQVVVQDIYCGTEEERASFETLHATIATYGEIFDRADEAETLTASLQDRVQAVSDASGDLGVATATVLYPSVGGGPLYTYGAGSMVTAQLDALGLENVFAGS